MLNWFRKKKKQPAETISTVQPNQDDSPNVPDYSFEYGPLTQFEGRNIIAEIKNQQVDGIVIEQLFSEEELTNMRFGIKEAYPEKFTKVGDVFTLPSGFASFAGDTGQSEEARNEYFSSHIELGREMESLLKVDFKARIEDAFAKITRGRTPLVAVGPEGKGKFAFTTVRIVPEDARMNPHCGNFFYERFNEFYNDLEKNVAVKNQLSFFVMITPPKEGGKLLLFDLRWEDGQQISADTTELFSVTKSGETVFTWKTNENNRTQEVPMKPGDMILFAAGEIWHMVNQPRGSIDRVTIGGFIGESRLEEGALCYWS